MKVTVIYGPPCSGKSTYAKGLMTDRTLLYDYDDLVRAVSLRTDHSLQQGVGHRYARAFRATFAERLRDDDSAEHAYILASKITDNLRDELDGLDVEYHRMDVDKQTCLDRLAADDDRPDKDAWAQLIEKWFDEDAKEVREVNYQRTAITRDTAYMTREAEDGARYIEGYFAVYGGEYRLWDGASETIDPGAFDLAEDRDVRALTNHDTTLVLGRTMAGTLELKTDERGLWGSIQINGNDQDAVNLYERVKRGDVTQCSFGFDILKEQIENRSDGATIFHLQRVKLWEVSVCTFPAYEETGVQARRAELADIQKRKREAWAASMLARLKGDN